MKIKAVSLWEPWASLVPGPKSLETRGWDTAYRGPLLICAAKRGLSPNDLRLIIWQEPFIAALSALFGVKLEDDVNTPKRHEVWAQQIISRLHFGMAVATCNLVATYPTETLTREQIGENLPFGDFRPKRFAWKLEDRKAIKEPFPVVGRQRLFEVEIPEGLL